MPGFELRPRERASMGYCLKDIEHPVISPERGGL